MVAQQIEAVVIGCGKPKFSMGWTHAYQLLQPPLSDMCTLTGVVEPFLLSAAAAENPEHRASAEEIRAFFGKEAPNAAVVDAVDKLPPCASGKVRLGMIAVRTPDSKKMFEAATDPSRGGCHAIYLEKPGACNVEELDEIISLAEKRGITVMTGYSRNLGNAVTGAVAFAEKCKGDAQADPRIELVHCNPWKPEELPECWRRCRPGMMFDMACHDIAIGVAHFGLKAEDLLPAGEGKAPLLELDVDTSDGASVQATYDGITDFVRLKFALRRQGQALHYLIDRCAGAFNGVYVTSAKETTKFLSGENPLWPNPLDDLAPHLACQYDYYVEAKRVMLQALATGPCTSTGARELPAGSPTLATAREVMLLAASLTEKLHAVVPFEKGSA